MNYKRILYCLDKRYLLNNFGEVMSKANRMKY
jgi:hypothetical protein